MFNKTINKKKIINNKGEKGFSLIDVLIALLILAFVLLSVVQILLLAMYNENTARHHTTLLFFGQAQMETLLSLPIGDVTDPRLAVYNILNDLTTADGCSAVTDRNLYCFDHALIDANHKWPGTLQGIGTSSPYYFMAWSVSLLDPTLPNGPRGVTLYIIPYPPPEGSFKSPVTLRGVAFP
ncbi:MAG: hypothetical protein A2Y62_04150 [Candidatus Fischerbacteria bacterium RBG_13_37_8]|uniref:Uncharacterized protein n=1 Tax=Candidatus Fischerbacteria bacterium RBG_13_37_8 TaxID=1817863 RepID=A0A1F5V660_9BACT|nr:MAG: hypothetical protein A2Y62_04150 [Candidatus Fischerbacteria bacterium RBG_13_37_8]